MNVWILQDKPGADLVKKLKERDTEQAFHWNILDDETTGIQEDDVALFWQPHSDAQLRGMVACGRVERKPYYKRDSESQWKIDIGSIRILQKRLSKFELENIPQLKKLEIFEPHGRRVFFVDPSEWSIIQPLRPEF